jgi:hypothetical protein
MHIVRIRAEIDVVRALNDIPDLLPVPPFDEGADGIWTGSAYATDDAVAAVRALGAEVDIMLDAKTRQAQLERVAEEARRSLEDGQAT